MQKFKRFLVVNVPILGEKFVLYGGKTRKIQKTAVQHRFGSRAAN